MDGQNINPAGESQNVGFPSASVPPKESNKNWKWLIVLVLFLIVIGGVTFFVFKSSRTTTTEGSPTPDTSSLSNIATPEPTFSPSPTPADKTQVRIQVLNGTGIPGEAGYLASALKDLGYTNVDAGNATTDNATATQVTFSSTLGSDVVAEITSKLNDVYQNVTTNNSTLTNYDIQITTGLRKGQTAKPADTATPEPSPTASSPTASPTATP